MRSPQIFIHFMQTCMTSIRTLLRVICGPDPLQYFHQFHQQGRVFFFSLRACSMLAQFVEKTLEPGAHIPQVLNHFRVRNRGDYCASVEARSRICRYRHVRFRGPFFEKIMLLGGQTKILPRRQCFTLFAVYILSPFLSARSEAPSALPLGVQRACPRQDGVVVTQLPSCRAEPPS